MPESSKPAVSIILPTYNRAKFLPEAFAAIREQQWTDWELIVVDDGSTDNTRELVPELTRGWPQPVRYIHQENQGAYGARNTGLNHATGKYIAFYDSDDLWLPHHLKDCIEALEANADVDWVYSASRIVDDSTGKVIADNGFYPDAKPLPFLSVRYERRGSIRILPTADAVAMAISHALNCGLQGSVIRQRVFNHLRLPPFRVGEDQTLSVLALKHGFRLAYFENVHFVYRTHEGGVSAGPGASIGRRAAASRELARAFEALLKCDMLTSAERALVRERVSKEYFWNEGYALQESGAFRAARQAFRRGLRFAPLSLALWKSYVASYVKGAWSMLDRRIHHAE